MSKKWYISKTINGIDGLSLLDKALLSSLENLDPKTISTTRLAHHFGISQPYVSRRLTKLKTDGYVNEDYSINKEKIHQYGNDRGLIVVEESIINNPYLNFNEKWILGYLVSFINSKGVVKPGNKFLSDLFGLSRSYISNSITKFVEKGYISRKVKKSSSWLEGDASVNAQRSLFLSEDNKKKIEEDGKTSVGLSTEQRGAKKAKEAWRRQYEKSMGKPWKDFNPKKTNAIWKQFVEALVLVAEKEAGHTVPDETKAQKLAHTIDTYYFELVERLMYIYFRERDHIFWEKTYDMYTPSEFTSLHCIHQLYVKYSNYYGASMKETHYRIREFERSEGKIGVDPSTLHVLPSEASNGKIVNFPKR